MMRILLPAALLLSALLAACASNTDRLDEKDVPQSGTLKVHPGLLTSPAAPRAAPETRQPVATPAPATATPPEAPAEQPSAR